MTNNCISYSPQIEEALLLKDFNGLYSIFTSQKISLQELILFYKRNKIIFKYSEFWLSELPHFHLDGVIGSDLKVGFLQSYLSGNRNCNDELNLHLVMLCREDFIRHFKLWKSYRQENLFNSLRRIAIADSGLERVKSELEIIFNTEQNLESNEQIDSKYFLQFSFGEIALAFSLFYYRFKQEKTIAGNKSLQIAFEMALVGELNKIFILCQRNQKTQLSYLNNDELQKQFVGNQAPHHILSKQSPDFISEYKFQTIYNLIDRMLERNDRRNKIELYLCGYADFKTITTNSGMLSTNNRFRLFKINVTKSVPEEYFFKKLTISTLNRINEESRIDVSWNLENLRFYGIPEIIDYSNMEIDFKKVFQVLNCFSVYKGPAERIFLNGNVVKIANRPPDSFSKLFGSNESITLFDFETLVNGIKEYFQFDENESRTIMSFLTFDINGKASPSEWYSKPFVKLNNQILWIGAFLKDRRWDNVIISRLRSEPKSVGVFAKKFELRIEELFRSKYFKTISGEKFTSSDGQSGDFDILAFRDNYLFVCEAKTGDRSESFTYAAFIETVRLEGAAAEQIEKSIKNIKEDWDRIKQKLEIDSTIRLNDIVIVPLIITDYFEGDLQLYKNSVQKISLLELDVILNNKKAELLEVYTLIQKLNDANNPAFIWEQPMEFNWDLWSGAKECKVEKLVENIEVNAVWKELEKIWKFDDITFSISY